MPDGSATITQILIPEYPYEPDGVRRVVMKLGPLEAMEMPVTSMQGDNLSTPAIKACEAMGTAAGEPVTTPAGSFDAMRSAPQGLGKDVWLAPEVPFGVVRMTDSDGKGLWLVAYGDDAVSSIERTASEEEELPPDAQRLIELMTAMHMEAGRVADEWDIGEFHKDMKFSFGGGVRISVEGLIIRVDLAGSKEGAEVQMFIGHAFE